MPLNRARQGPYAGAGFPPYQPAHACAKQRASLTPSKDHNMFFAYAALGAVVSVITLLIMRARQSGDDK